MTNEKATTKQLKKNDFLAVVTEASKEGPITKGQLVDALEEYTFIPTWLDFLIEHFENLGRIEVVRDAEGNIETINRSAKSGGGSGSGELFRVVGKPTEGEEAIVEYSMETKTISGVMTKADRDEGWSMTAKAAVRRAKSAVFAQYKADTAALTALLEVDEEEAEEADTESMD